MLPKISIVIPCYNHGQYVREAIESVEQCSDKSLYEIIIINDGSTDDYTIEVMKQLEEEGYHVINQRNQGLGPTRNNAIKAAKGEYILPLDSDNKIRPEYIYESIKILDADATIVMVYGDAQFFGDTTKKRVVGRFNLQQIMIENYIDACTVFRKSAWKAAGGYDEKMPVMGFEDWDLWLNLSFKNYKFQYVDKILFDYRILGDSMLRSVSTEKKKLLYEYLNNKYKNYLNLNILNEKLLNAAKRNKKIALKFFLSTYFPRVVNFLVKRKLITDSEIF